MTHDLACFQSAFAEALLAPAGAPSGLLAGLRAQPAFAVYRNTVMKGCIDALEANFPSVARLVGPDWFRAAAAMYAAEQPAPDARLLYYGARFAAFLETFEPARDHPYLPGVASLDRDWTEVHSAPDAGTDASFFAALSPEVLGATRVAPHPAARWRWFDEMPVYGIWSRNRRGEAASNDAELQWQGDGALLTRRNGAVLWRSASMAECAFLDSCQTGGLLVDAAVAAQEVDPGVDLAELLAGLLRAEALVAEPPTSNGEIQ